MSPLLSNILLDDLDKELERRGHNFCRYADDSNFYVATRRSGERVMQSLTRFLEHRLKLKVNAEKSATRRKERGSAALGTQVSGVHLPCGPGVPDRNAGSRGKCGTKTAAT